MPKVLRNLKFKKTEAFSVVDKGANPHAKVLIYKRGQEPKEQSTMGKVKSWFSKQEGEETEKMMSIEEAVEGLPEDRKQAILAAIAAAAGSTGESEGEGDKAAAEDDKNEMSKRDLPEAIRKRLDAADKLEKRLAEVEKREQRREFTKRAEALEFVPMATDELADVLEAVDGLEKRDAIVQALEAMNTQIKKGGIFKEFGRSGDPENLSASEAIAKRAKEIRKENPSMPIEKARYQARREDPELAARESKGE